MKIPAHEADRFTLSPTLQAALIYGPDTGLVAERSVKLALQVVADIHDPFSVAYPTASQLNEHPTLLYDGLHAINFLGGRRLVWVKEADHDITAAVKAAVEAPAEGFLLLSAGDLSNKSSLRLLAETHPRIATIPCYVEEGAALEQLIGRELRARGFTIGSDALELLSDILPGDRQMMKSELDKLMIYMGEEKSILLSHVEQVVHSNGEADFQAIVNAAASGNLKLLTKQLYDFQLESGQPVAILRSAIYYFTRLYQLRGHIDHGASIDSAIQQLRPPVFFKQKPLLRTHLQRFSHIGQISSILSLLYQAELDCKRTLFDTHLMANRHLTKLARAIAT